MGCFISEDNLQKKKIIDSHLRITELREGEKVIKKQLSDLEQLKAIKINEEDNYAKKILTINFQIDFQLLIKDELPIYMEHLTGLMLKKLFYNLKLLRDI